MLDYLNKMGSIQKWKNINKYLVFKRNSNYKSVYFKENKMKNIICKLMVFVVVSMIVLAPLSQCKAESNRSGKSELDASFLFLGGASADVGDVSISEEDWTVYGLAYGINTSENLNVNIELLYTSIDLKASGLDEGESLSGSQQTFITLLNVEYNILSEPLTPYITGGLGYGFSFGNVEYDDGDDSADVDAVGTGFAYTIGAGGRWDISDNLFVKLSYRILWDDAGDSRDGFGLNFGFMF